MCVPLLFTMLLLFVSFALAQNPNEAWEAADDDAAVVRAQTIAIKAVGAQLQTVETGVFTGIAFVGIALLILFAFCTGYYVANTVNRNAYQNAQLMAYRTDSASNARNVGMFYGHTANEQQQQQPGRQQNNGSNNAYVFGSGGAPSAASLQPMTSNNVASVAMQHRQASAAVATLTQYSSANQASSDVLSSLRVGRRVRSENA